MDRTGEEERPGDSAEALHEQDVLEKGLRGKAADLVEEVAGHEEGLVAIREAEPADALGIAPFQNAVNERPGLDPLLEGTETNFPAKASSPDLPDGLARQPVVRVQEQEHVSAGGVGAGILLNGSAARR